MPADDSDGDESSDMDEDSPATNVNRDRIRCFPISHPGPFVVSIREATIKLSPIRFSLYINKKYSSVTSIKQLPQKMKITLSHRGQANEIIADKTFENYKVYVPAAEVEIDGVVSFNDLCDIGNLKNLKKLGKGKFGNPEIKPVEILESKRLSKADPENKQVTIITNDIKVTFAGSILPNHILVEGLLIKVRPFHRKAMFCEKCLQFEHTSKYCHRKPKCARCEGNHSTTNCNMEGIDKTLCPYCSQKHAPNIDACSHFKDINSSFSMAEKSKRQSRYATAVAIARAKEVESMENSQVPPISDPQPGTNSSAVAQAPNAISNGASNNLQSATTYANISKNTSLTPTNNRYSALSQYGDEEQQSFNATEIPRGHPRRQIIANPWAKAGQKTLSATHETRSQSRKRRRLDANTTPINSPTASTPEPSSSNANPPGFNPTTTTAKDIIKSICSQLGLTPTWTALVVNLAGPILETLLPYVKNILSTLIPALFSSLNG